MRSPPPRTFTLQSTQWLLVSGGGRARLSTRTRCLPENRLAARGASNLPVPEMSGGGVSFPTLSPREDMKISGVDIRPGNIIEYEGGIWRAVKIQHTQPGKGGAYMQVEMKNLIDGRKNNVRFRSAETVERVRLDTKDFQFLFKDGDALTFMDTETYEQITLPTDLLGDAAAFFQDGMD